MASLPDARLTDSDMPAVVRGERPQMVDADLDALMRMAAFDQVRRLSDVHTHLTANKLRPGARIWYDDQREVHRQIFESEEAVDYAFTATRSLGPIGD